MREQYDDTDDHFRNLTNPKTQKLIISTFCTFQKFNHRRGNEIENLYLTILQFLILKKKQYIKDYFRKRPSMIKS